MLIQEVQLRDDRFMCGVLSLGQFSLLGAIAKRGRAIIRGMSLRLFVRPSVHMEQLGSYRTDFREIWYLSIFRKYVGKIPV
jgi:hypothetical protein